MWCWGIHMLTGTQHIPEPPTFHSLQGYLQEHLTYKTGGSLRMPYFCLILSPILIGKCPLARQNVCKCSEGLKFQSWDTAELRVKVAS